MYSILNRGSVYVVLFLSGYLSYCKRSFHGILWLHQTVNADKTSFLYYYTMMNYVAMVQGRLRYPWLLLSWVQSSNRDIMALKDF